MRFLQFDGHNIDDAVYETPYVFDQGAAGSFGTDPVEAEIAEQFPQSITAQPLGRDFVLTVTHLQISRPSLQLIEQWFDPSPARGERYLTRIDENNVVHRLLCRPLQIQHIGPNQTSINMHAASAVWEADIEVYTSQTIAASLQPVALINAGNTKAPLRLALTPTASKADTTGQGFMQRVAVANRNVDATLDDQEGDGYPVDIAAGALDTATLTTAKLLASGDDLAVWENGDYVPRWLINQDTANTSVWCNVREPRGSRVTLAAAMASSSSPAVGALIVVSNPTLTDELGLDEFLIVDTEVIHVQKASRSELRILGRGQLGSTAAAHNAGSVAWRMTNPYRRLVYDYASAGTYDDYGISDRKPLIGLGLSSNTKHVWSSGFINPGGSRRSGGWQLEKSNDGPTSDAIRVYERMTAAQFVIANARYLGLADNAALSTGNIDFTLTGWVYFDGVTGVQMLVSKWSNVGNNVEYAIFLNGASLFFQVSPDGTEASAVGLASSVTMAIGRWYHIAAWHDSVNDTMNLQVNGVLSSVAYAGGILDKAASFLFGAYTTGGSITGFLGGRLQMWTFHKRVLSSSERAWLYNNGTGRRFEEVFWMSSSGFRLNFIDLWQLNELSGTRAGVNGNNVAESGAIGTAEGIVPGDAIVFEDALAAAGKPSFNSLTRSFPVPVAAAPAAIELDEEVNNNLILRGYATDLDGNKIKLFTRNPTAALVNQQFTPASLTQRFTLSPRIANVIGYYPAIGTLVAGNDIGETSSFDTTGVKFTLDQTTRLTGLVLALQEAVASSDTLNCYIYAAPADDATELRGYFAQFTAAQFGASLAYAYADAFVPIVLPAGDYWLTLFKQTTTGSYRVGLTSQRQHARIWYRSTIASESPANSVGVLIISDEAEPQEDAATGSGDKATVQNFEATFDATRAPLIVRGAEEVAYVHDSRWRLVRNLVTNSGFESNTTGHAATAPSTIGRSTEQAHYDPARGFFGKASLKCTFQATSLILDEYAITLPIANQNYTASAWVYIPAAWNAGADIALDFVNFASSTPGAQVNADLTKRDQWQQIRLTELMSADVAGLLRVVTSGTAPTAAEFIYIDDLQIEPGTEVYGDGFFSTDGEEGGAYLDINFVQALNQRLEIDAGRRLVLDRELNLQVPFAVTPSNADSWPGLAPGFNILRPTEAGIASMTLETWHRPAYL